LQNNSKKPAVTGWGYGIMEKIFKMDNVKAYLQADGNNPVETEKTKMQKRNNYKTKCLRR